MDIDALSTDELEQELNRLEVLRRQVTALQTMLIAEADRRQVPMGDGCASVREWVSTRLDVDQEEAKRLTRLSKRLSDLPSTFRRLSEGEIGPARAELVTRVATAADEERWVDRLAGFGLSAAQRLAARHRPVSRSRERELERQSYLVMQPSLDEAWWSIRGGVGSVAGKTISETLRRHADALPDRTGSLAHRQAVALEQMCIQEGPDVPNAQITAFVDLGAANGSGGESGAEIASGPRVGPNALEELLCGGSVRIVGLENARPVVTTSNSDTIPPAVRAFVLWRDQGMCRAPGCTSRRMLQPHHIYLRSHGGSHHPDDLITLCWFHHHIVVHRRGMRLEKAPDGTIRFLLPADSRDPP